MTTLRQSPFAAVAYRQRRAWGDSIIRGCQQCGRLKYTQAGRPFLHQYRVETPQRKWDIDGVFCTLTCCRIFYNERKGAAQ